MGNYRAFMAKLNRDTESEMIAWIEAQGSFTDLLRKLVTSAMTDRTDQVTHADLLQAITSLSTRIDNVSVLTSTGAGDTGDVDGTQEAAGNLDNLGY